MMEFMRSVSEEGRCESVAQVSCLARDDLRRTRDTRLTFAGADFSGAFADGGPAATLQKIKIGSLPAHGTLRLGGTCSYTSNNLNQYTAAGTAGYQYDPNGNLASDGAYSYTYDEENRLVQVKKTTTGEPIQNLDSFGDYTTGGDAAWVEDAYLARSGDIADEQESWGIPWGIPGTP